MGDTGGGRSSVVLGDDEEEVFGKIKRTVEASRASAQKDPADEDPPDEDFPDDDEPPLLSADEVDAAWEMEPAPAEGASAVESVADDPARAGGWRRGAAAALDLGVSLAALGVAVLVSELLWLRSGGQVSAPLWLLAAVFAGAGWTHTLVGEGLCGGATLGKRALGLRVAVPGGGALPVWRVALRRLCLDTLLVALAAVARWFTMVRQHGRIPAGGPVGLDASDAAVFCAFFLNLVVLAALARRFDPRRRFPHDWVAGLSVVCDGDAEAGAGAAAGSGGRRVAAPVGAVRPRWDDETAEVASSRPWDGRKWRLDPAAAAKAADAAEARRGPLERLVERVVAWGEPARSKTAGEGAVPTAWKDVPLPARRRRPGAVARLADRLVAWSEGEPRTPDGGAGN